MPKIEEKRPLKPWSPATYRIEIDGFLEEGWAENYTGMRIITRKRKDHSHITSLTGCLRDQSELLGVLNSIADLHLSILIVEKLDEGGNGV